MFKAIYRDNILVKEAKNLDLRNRAKILNFGILYGMSAYKLSSDFNVSIEEAQEFIDMFFEAYPSLKVYLKKKENFLLTNGYVLINELTRRRSYSTFLHNKYVKFKSVIFQYKEKRQKVPKRIWSKFFSTKGVLSRKAGNYPVQGTAAEMTKLALCDLYFKIHKNNFFEFIKIVNVIHDEIILEVHKGYEEIASMMLRDSMQSAGKALVKTVPITAEPVISNY